MTVIPIIVGVLGTIHKKARKRLREMEIKSSKITIETKIVCWLVG